MNGQQAKRPIVIGILGGVASGKSAVTQLMQRMGAEVISADAIAHGVLRQRDIVEAIVHEFGLGVLEDSTQQNLELQQIDRKKLGAIVFGDDSLNRRRALEAIVHPRIRQIAKDKLNELIDQNQTKWIVLDAPLLIEGGWLPFCDRVVFVETPDTKRREFASARGWDDFEWKRREQAQLPLEQKRQVATDILINDGGLDSLQRKVASLIEGW